MSACPLVVLACESLHVCTVCIWRCEHARFCVEVFYALYVNFHSFIQGRGCRESDVRSVGGSGYKYHFCRNKHVFVTTNVCLPRQNFCCNKIMLVVTKYFCHDKTFVVTNICHDKHGFVVTIFFFFLGIFFFFFFFGRDKHTFLVTKHMFCSDKLVFVMTKKKLSQQNYVCRDKYLSFVTTKICRILVATKDKHLSRQK